MSKAAAIRQGAEDLGFGGARIVQVRIARPTNRLEEVVAFYRDGLGLAEIYRFQDHDGYDGVMLGLPGRSYHLEFTRHANGTPCPAPTRDNLLVLYVPDREDFLRLCRRLEALGHRAVEPENPYWAGKSATFEDPDGWRVVLCETRGI